MKKNCIKIRLIIFSLILILAISIFVFLIQVIKEKHKKTEQKLLEWQTIYTKQQELLFLNNSIEKIQENQELLNKYFIYSSNIVPFLNYLEDLAKKNKLTIDLSLVDIMKEEEGLIVEMGVIGNFNLIFKFIKFLENSPYQMEFLLVSLNNISLDEDENKNENILKQWEALIKIKLLSFIK